MNITEYDVKDPEDFLYLAELRKKYEKEMSGPS